MKSIDGIIALLYYLFNSTLIYLFGLFMFKTDVYIKYFKYFSNENFYRFLFYIPFTIIAIAPIVIIIHFRKQSLSSIGIKKSGNFKSVFKGVLFALPFVLPTIIYGIKHNYNFNNINNLIWTFLYFLICIGFEEELAFRGFIQIRIMGLIRNKWLSIIIVGLMFGVMHIPFQMLKANMSLIQFVKYDYKHLITTMVIHIYLVYIYTRDNNIVAPTITHTLMNFVSSIFV